MKRIYKSFFSIFLLVIIVLASVSPVPAQTGGYTTDAYGNPIDSNATYYLYEDGKIYKEEDLIQVIVPGAVKAASLDDMMSAMYQKVVSRTTEMSYYYPNSQVFDADSFQDYVNEINQYEAGNIESISYHEYSGFENYIVYEFTFTYHTTAAEEAAVDSKISQILPSLNQGSDLDKVMNVHNYLCNNITYVDNYNGAFHALIDGKAVCNGYALAFYKIMKAMNIPVEYNTGDSAFGPHAWNTVYVNGKWYNIDVTWDDQTSGIIYRFFLRGNKFFTANYNGSPLHEYGHATSDENYIGSWNQNEVIEYNADGSYTIYSNGKSGGADTSQISYQTGTTSVEATVADDTANGSGTQSAESQTEAQIVSEAELNTTGTASGNTAATKTATTKISTSQTETTAVETTVAETTQQVTETTVETTAISETLNKISSKISEYASSDETESQGKKKGITWIILVPAILILACGGTITGVLVLRKVKAGNKIEDSEEYHV